MKPGNRDAAIEELIDALAVFVDIAGKPCDPAYRCKMRAKLHITLSAVLHTLAEIERLRAAVAAERERCAKVAQSFTKHPGKYDGETIADTIRKGE